MKVLAIDIGSSQIKSIVVDIRFRGFDTIHHQIVTVADLFEEIPQPQSDDEVMPFLTKGQTDALIRVTNGIPVQIDRIVVNLPLTSYSSRKMTFPFANRKKIKAALQFAIEDEIPFPIDECIYSFKVLQEKGAKEATVLNSIVPISLLERFLNALAPTKIDPDIISTDQSAITDFIHRNKENFNSGGFAIIDFGHRKTNSYYFQGTEPLFQKTTMVGGLNVTRAIAEKYKLGINDAELAKVDRGFLATRNMKLNTDQQAFAKVISDALAPVFHDLNQSFMAYTSKKSARIEQVYVCGGGSQMPGLNEYLMENFGCKVEPFRTISQLTSVSLKLQPATETYLANATSLGLAQTKAYAQNTINFRSGEMRKEAEALKIPWNKIAYPMKLASIVYMIAILSFSAQKIIFEKQAKAQDRLAERQAQRLFKIKNRGIINKILSDPSQLKKKADAKVNELQSQLNVSNEPIVPSFSTLNLINSLSKTVPRSAVMEIRKAMMSAKKVQLTIESPTEQNAASAMAALKQNSNVQEIKASKIVKLPTGRYQFKFEFVPRKQGS